jgi:hypothetical protein
MKGAATKDIIDIVDQCPTDALTWKWNRDLSLAEKQELENEAADVEVVPAPVTEIKIIENGPALIKGKLRMSKASGEIIETPGQIALCRCGASQNKPFCDGTHHNTKFKG